MSEFIDPRGFKHVADWAAEVDVTYPAVDVPVYPETDADWRGFVDQLIELNPNDNIPLQQRFNDWRSWAAEYMLVLTAGG